MYTVMKSILSCHSNQSSSTVTETVVCVCVCVYGYNTNSLLVDNKVALTISSNVYFLLGSVVTLH
jgi:hypothetical protein